MLKIPAVAEGTARSDLRLEAEPRSQAAASVVISPLMRKTRITLLDA